MANVLPVLIVLLSAVFARPVFAGQAGQDPKPSAPSSPALSLADLTEVYVLFMQGRDQADRRDTAGAIASYRKALALAPAAADVRAELAGLYVRSGQIIEARVEARRAIETDSDNRDAHQVLGLIEAAEILQSPVSATPAMLQEAIGHLEYALAGGVQDLAVQLTVAELYLQHGNTTRAEAAARRFLEQRPGFPRAVMVLVAALDASGRSAEVGAELAELREEPASELLALADAFLEGGAPRHALTLLEPRVASPLPEDIESGAFGRMATVVGMAWTALGEPKRAIAAMEGARQRKASGRSLLFTLGAAYERDGQHDAAERTFRTLIADDPAHHEALNYLGYMLADRGQKLDEAVSFISRALAIRGDEPSYLDSLGWAYFRQRRFDEARPPLERAAAALPQVSVIQDHLGDLYLEMKRYGEAATAFDRALGGNREDVDVAAITRKRDRARELASQK
jgi:tetratricopeptide (TPR) repeat protein